MGPEPGLFIPALALVLVSAAGAGAPSEPGWSRARTAHFEVLTDAGEPLARSTADRLERLRGVLLVLFPPRSSAERRIVALLLASSSTFEELVPRRHRRPHDVAGFFQGSAEWDAIVARVSTERRGPFASLDHEYAHVLLNRSLPAQPVWAAEGLAELLSDAELDTDEARLGAGVPELEERSRASPLPLAKLLELRHDAPEYLGALPDSGLYPSSWALARWVVARRGLAGLREYLDALSLGADPVGAFEEKLGPLAAAQATLTDVSRTPLLRVAAGETAAASGPPQLDVPSPAEVEHRLGELLLREGEPDRSRPHLERALAAAPDSIPVRISLAELRRSSGEPALARRELERALAAWPDDPRALLYDARLRVEESRSAGVPLGAPLEARLVAQLERALARAPDLYEAALLLVDLRPEPYAERRRALEPVFEQDPSRTEVALAIAGLDKKLRDLASAERVLRRAREATTEPAYRFLCDRELAEIADFQAATVEVRGRLIHLECRPDGGLRFTVDAPGAVLLLEAASSRSFLVYGANEAGGESELVCGLQDRPLVVRYERLEPPQSGVEGRVLWLSLPGAREPERRPPRSAKPKPARRPPSE